MKSTLSLCVTACLLFTVIFEGQALGAEHTRDNAIAKARQCLRNNVYARCILDAHKAKDLLNPENKVHSNSVVVSQGLKEVKFHHNGNPYDSDSITFVVKMDEHLSMVEITIKITPGGHE